MTATYEQSGIRFLYPENWKISDEDLDSAPQTVSLQCPGSGFWTLHLYSGGQTPATLVAEVLGAMRQEYDEFEFESLEEKWDDVETCGYVMHFYCLDLLVTARVLGIRDGRRTYIVLWQAENREFDELEPVFRAVTMSLIKKTGVV